jgi:predicted kinase
MRQELVLIRGLPGSGKSTLAKAMKNHVHLEADMYFMVDGEYCFDHGGIKRAHEWCQSECFMHLKTGRSVVVSNTFTQQWEMRPYIDMAKRLDVPVRVIVADGQYQNVHNVPDEVIVKMRQRWEA